MQAIERDLCLANGEIEERKERKKEHRKQASIKVYLIFMTIIKDVQSIANFSFT